MNDWAVDGAGVLLLCIGVKLGQPRFLRGLCSLALIYIIIFSSTYYVWLKWKFEAFKAHPEMIHVGISAGFAFESFWNLLGNMLMLLGFMPLAILFGIYFAIKWLVGSTGRGSSFF